MGGGLSNFRQFFGTLGPTPADTAPRSPLTAGASPAYGTRMRVLVAAVLAVGLLAVAAPVPAAPGTEPAPLLPPDAVVPGGLDLSIRARALGVAPEPQGAATLGLEPMRAPTGAGSMRWPQPVTEVGKGVYISVEPVCLPGADPFPLRPPRPRR